MWRRASNPTWSDHPRKLIKVSLLLLKSLRQSEKTIMVAIPLGASVPALTPHAISVSLPTWRDNVGYEEGDKRVVDRMETGYPRFFIHRSIQKVRFRT